MTKLPKQHFLILLSAMLFGGLLSIYFGKELCWDLANYHFYNPYALLHRRNNIDLWPTNFIHQYLNPTLDLLTYFLITKTPPLFAEFYLGALHGINFWLLFLIAERFIDHQYKILTALLIALLGMYGPTVLPGIGSFQNDNLICLFVLSSLLLFLDTTKTPTRNHTSRILLSGLLLGCGVGLKFTAGIYVIGLGVTFFFLPFTFKHNIQLLITWSIAVAVGICLTSGYWMWHLWTQYHNPIFPFLNHLFHSPFFIADNWRDTRFLPTGLLQTFFYPFYFSWDGRIADASFQDFRYLFVYVLLVITFVVTVIQRNQSHNKMQTMTKSLIVFFIISYIVWQSYFSIARYLAPLEMLAPLMIYLLVTHLIPSHHYRIIVISFLFMTLALAMRPTKMIRARWYQTDFFNIQLPTVVSDTPAATVLIALPAYALERDPRPQSYLIPYFPARWQFIGIPFQQHKLHATQAWLNTIQTHLNKTQPIYLLAPTSVLNEFNESIEQFKLNATNRCYPITSDRQRLSNESVWLCELKRES